MKLWLIYFSVLTAPAIAADLPEVIQWGAKRGQVVTVIDKKGMNTATASARLRHTRANALAYCRGYRAWDDEFAPVSQCIHENMSIELTRWRISANCEIGKVLNMVADEPVFYVAPSAFKYADASEAEAEWFVGMTLDVFYSLCPIKARDFYNAWNKDDQKPVMGSLSTPTVTTGRPEVIQWGPKRGHVVTVVNKRGMNTENATADLRHTRANALAYCRSYRPRDDKFGPISECVRENMDIGLPRMNISANCTAGAVTNMWNEGHIFGYANSPMEEDWFIDVTLSVFYSLCPDVAKGFYDARFKSDQKP